MHRDDRAGVRRDVLVDLREVGGRRLRRLRRDVGDREAPVELGRRDRDLVEVVLGAEVHADRDDADAELLEHRRRQVAGRVRHDADARRAVLVEARLVLRAHVLDLGLRHVGEARRGLEEPLGLVGVDVEADPRRAARDHDRVAEQGDLAPQRVAVDGVALEQDLGAVAEQDRLGGPVEDRGPDVLGRRRRPAPSARTPGSTARCPRAGTRSPGRPASTTPAFWSAFICLGVFSSDTRAALSDSGSRTPKSRHLAAAVGDVPRPVADDRQDRPLDGPRDRRSTPTRPPRRRRRRSRWS